MAKTKYYYDQESCSYKKIELTKKKIFLKFIKSSSFILCIASILSFIKNNYFESEKERYLSKENNNLKTQYELIMQDMGKIENTLDELQKQDDHVYRVILCSDKLSPEMRKAGIGGVDHYKNIANMDKHKLIMKITQKADKLKYKLNIQSQSYKEIINLAKKRKKQLACTPSIQPVGNIDLRRLSSGFGMRPHPTLKIPKMHKGQDFAVLCGTPVYATADGIVKKAYYSRTGGNTIEIRHGKFLTKYLHLKSMRVKTGENVYRGKLIGKSGTTGTHSTGPHLHYEILELKNGRFKHVNPIGYFFGELTSTQYEQVKKMSKRDIISMD